MYIFFFFLKDSSCYDSLQLENQINTCFELHCEVEGYQYILKESELKDDYTVLY